MYRTSESFFLDIWNSCFRGCGFSDQPFLDAGLVVKDYKSGGHGVGLPDYTTFKQARFPFNMVNEALVSPVKAFGEFGAELPVFFDSSFSCSRWLIPHLQQTKA